MLKIDNKDYTWFLFALTLIFVAAKSFGFLTAWSWFMTFIPFWIVGGFIVFGYLVIYGFMLICLILYGVYHGIKNVLNRENG